MSHINKMTRILLACIVSTLSLVFATVSFLALALYSFPQARAVFIDLFDSPRVVYEVLSYDDL